MRKFLLGCLGAVLVVFAIHSATVEVKADSCNPCDSIFCDSDVGCTPKSKWIMGGHLETGIYVNQYGQKNSYIPGGNPFSTTNNGLHYLGGNTGLLNNVNQSDLQMNQMYMYFGKELDTRRGWDFGGQVDFMYGTDAKFVQSRGLEFGAGRGAWNSGDYYTALPQMFAEAGYKNVSVKAGKFLTPLGHESVLSTDRFFYSLGYCFGASPVTHSGIVATWKANERLSVFGGWVNGRDSFFDSRDDNAFLGGFKYELNHRIGLGYTALIGKDKALDEDYFEQTFVVDVKLGKRWHYAFEWLLINENFGATNFAEYGINNELLYKVNKKLSVGGRLEWLSDFDSDNLYGFTLGANWTPRSWLTVKPEIRYDRVSSSGNPWNWTPFNSIKGNGKNEQLSSGLSMILSY